MSKSLDQFVTEKLAAAEARDRLRSIHATERGEHMAAGDLISFTDNDYLGLSTDPRLKDAAIRATERYGAGSGASRLVTGNHPLFGELEARLAAMKGAEAATVFGSGYMANSGIIPALMGKDDLILADALVHASLHAGIRLSGATVRFFRHNDPEHAGDILRAERSGHPRAMILVDGVYSMDGDIAPLGPLADLAEAYDAWLMADDAHGFGVLGGGRGTVHHLGVQGRVPLMMGTLSKAVGSYGGYLAASRPVIDCMKNRARSLIYTTGLPPGVIGAAIEALDIIEAEPERCLRPTLLAKRFTKALGLPQAETPLVPITLGSDRAALDADAALRKAGFRVAAFRPPTVPEGTARLRVSFSATHRDADVDALIDAVRALGVSGQTEAAE